MADVQQQLIKLQQDLLDSIANRDWETYAELCDESLTAFEPEAGTSQHISVIFVTQTMALRVDCSAMGQCLLLLLLLLPPLVWFMQMPSSRTADQAAMQICTVQTTCLTITVLQPLTAWFRGLLLLRCCSWPFGAGPAFSQVGGISMQHSAPFLQFVEVLPHALSRA
jgi:hypothetical protein